MNNKRYVKAVDMYNGKLRLVNTETEASKFLLTPVRQPDGQFNGTYNVHMTYYGAPGFEPSAVVSVQTDNTIFTKYGVQSGGGSDWKIRKKGSTTPTLNGIVELVDSNYGRYMYFDKNDATTDMTSRSSGGVNGTEFYFEFLGTDGVAGSSCVVSNPFQAE